MKRVLRRLSTYLTLPLAISCSDQGTEKDVPGGTGAHAATGGAPPASGGSGGTTATTGGETSTGGTGNTTATGGGGNANTGGTSTGGAESTGGATATGGGVTTGGAEATGGTIDVPDPPRLENPQDGHATHYWDCCKPSCAWPDQGSAKSCTSENQLQSNPDEQSGCFGGNSYQCWSMSPWAVSDTLAYGFAAFNSGACGSCYQIEFTGTSSAGYDDPGSASISHKIMIVQTLNRGGIGQGQFDILVPGGGVGDFDACSTQWDAHGDLGARYGGFYLECRQQNGGNPQAAMQCARDKCEEIFDGAGKEDLLSGCLFWLDWANMADNPNFKYGPVECPAAITAVSGM